MLVNESEAAARQAGLTRGSPGLVTLSAEECWSLLRAQNLGRLGIVVGAWPRIFPVNYAADEETVVFRTDPGAKLQQGPGSAACFQVDGYDPKTERGWSVMAVGVLEDITAGDDKRSRRLRALAVQPLAPGTRSHWLALAPREVTGRSFQGSWILPGYYLG
jgi:nitroimidazol reductase NimA-like FMN-containing flavoprotein (pyridoxamine 5'-phosphate oxidase superfamily)